MTATVWELLEERNRRQAQALNACFDFGVDSATQIVQSLTHANQMATDLDEPTFKKWISGQMHDWAHEHRRELKQMFVDAEAWYQTEVEKRVDEIEEMMWSSVKGADPATILEMSKASEETLKNVLETAKSTGNVATFELVLKVAYDRDLDLVVASALEGNEELEALYAELIQAQEVPLYEDPAGRFEMLGEQVPSANELLIKGADLLRLQYGIPSR